ncbi:hypothetical protein J3R83DRAFT_14028 [Lanmaoa asiatica]|nr:hypothetical protein J3R83DRAFT_14028 [Lanmaoa asiatica]
MLNIYTYYSRTVSSFKQLKLANNDNLPKLAPLAIAQGTMYAVACAFQTFGIVAAVTVSFRAGLIGDLVVHYGGQQRFNLIRLYAFLCALSTLLAIGVGILRVITHFAFKVCRSSWITFCRCSLSPQSDLITECTTIAQTGSIGSVVFGIWGSNPTTHLDQTQALQFCENEWNHDSWAEIVALVVEAFFGILFTAIAFAYYRQELDPTSLANSSRLPSDQARTDGYPTYYNPPYDGTPYDGTAYVPVYLPPLGPPPTDGKPPEYKRSSYLSFGGDKDAKEDAKEDDPFSDYDGPSVPMPTHWVEDRDTTSLPRK